MTYAPLSIFDLATAAALLLVNGAISLTFRLGLGRSLALAALRMVIQLALIGYVLTFIFTQASPAWTFAMAAVMVAVAGFEIAQRQDRPFTGLWTHGLGAVTLLTVGSCATLYAVLGAIGPDPWWSPRYLLPIFGMVLGNTLTAVSLALQTITDAAWRERTQLETRLALGATRLDAFAGVLRRTLRTALMPIINAMAAAGIVTLPGMMTGQILAGIDPADAAKYQILIMFVIAGAAALGAVIAAFAAVWRLTDHRHRLRLDRLQAATDNLPKD
jgi:putative ABC transport system permease protein